MPTLSEMLVGGTMQEAQQAPDLSGAITKGAALAESINNMKTQREQIEIKKQELQMQKAIAVTDTLKIAASSKDKNLKNFLLKNVMPGKIKALGMEEFFTPQTMEMIQTSDAVQQKVLGLQLYLDEQIRAGKMTGAEAFEMARSTFSDPEELALLDTDKFFAAQEFAKSETGKGYRAMQVAQASLGKQVQGQDAAGNVELKKETAKEVALFQGGGGAALEASRKKLEGVVKALKTGSVQTGGISTLIPGLKSDAVQTMLNPEMISLKNDARSAMFPMLRATFGSGFTENEGNKVFDSVWDDKQAPQENAKRVQAKLDELTQQIADKKALFREQGFKIDDPPAAPKDWKKVLGKQKQKALQLKGAELQKYIDGFAKKHDTSPEEVKKLLGL